jgi:hypothetical protein
VPKGWDRMSISANTRPIRPRRRNVSPEELLVPGGGSKLVLFLACLACGAMLSVLWGWFGVTLVILSLRLHSGAWAWWAMLAIGVVSTLTLFAYASWEREHDHEWLERF